VREVVGGIEVVGADADLGVGEFAVKLVGQGFFRE
jgi:hypothetical protein